MNTSLSADPDAIRKTGLCRNDLVCIDDATARRRHWAPRSVTSAGGPPSLVQQRLCYDALRTTHRLLADNLNSARVSSVVEHANSYVRLFGRSHDRDSLRVGADLRCIGMERLRLMLPECSQQSATSSQVWPRYFHCDN